MIESTHNLNILRFHGRNAASVVTHCLLFSLSLLAAFVLAHNFQDVSAWFFPQYMMLLMGVLLVKYVVFSVMGQHERSWRYAGYRDFFAAAWASVICAVLLYTLVYSGRTLLSQSRYAMALGFPDSVVLLDAVLSTVGITAARLAFRTYFERGFSLASSGRRKLIVGAGDAGETLIREILRMSPGKHHVVGLLDDDVKKQGSRIHGVRILGSVNDIRELCAAHGIDEVLIAIPSAPKKRIREIVQLCEGAKVQFKIMPDLGELIEGTRTLESQLRHVRVEDLLTRAPVNLDTQSISDYLEDKVVMVTGAGGSIGSEMCRQIIRFKPKRLILVELSENNLFELQRELDASEHSIPITGYLADICDEFRMAHIFAGESPDIICHAAAHKHVPMLEAHPGEAIKNNIVGTLTIANLAVKHGVWKFVYISTDKAVNPTSIMGCTKRIAEIYVQGLSQQTTTQFITVRFGNVLGSRGSVVPIFQQQIAQGGPVTVTHPEMTRYFMTIPEAAQLVLQAGALGKGGEIFLLEMGAPVKIVDLARNLITLMGLVPDEDIHIEYTGLRPGEKLYEELYIEGEGLVSTPHPRIKVWEKRAEDWDALCEAIPQLVALASSGTADQIKPLLAKSVPEYRGTDSVETKRPARHVPA